ncbi:MAG: carboxypeptidase regulatory-like domain-containing protein, partial [Bacteriovoracaceae bacterium]|nr:carboxypeptidase regulatory-like domain-containing protein [Bacteriovoracaceae bacterium]
MKLIFLFLISALTLQVQAANQKPVPVAIANPTTGYLPLEVQLDGSGSYDPDGQVVSYEWKFSGGETLTGQQVSYVFNKNRKDSVRLTVTDNEGKKDSSTLELNFSQDNQAPVISLELPDDFEFRTATPNILVEWEDATSQVDLSRVEFILDGVNVISHVELTAHSGSLQFTSTWPLSPGAHRLKVVVQDFYKNKATRIINFSYSAPIVRPNQLNGVVLDTNKQPVAGVQIISVTGPVASPLSGVTDAQGKYSLPFTVAGDYQLQFLKDGYLSTYKYKTILAGVDDVLPDVFMAVADTKTTLVESSSGGVATNTSGSISLVVPPGSLDMNRELSFTEAVTGKTLQVPLPNGSQFTFAQNNQPSGTQFSSPATMAINNILGFNPGTEIPVGVTQEGLGVWEDTGFKGIVSADGSKVVFNVTHFSDYDVNLNTNSPEDETQDPTDPETTDSGGNKINDDCGCKKGSRINATTNELYIDYELPSVMRNGRAESIGLTYASLGANPHALLAVSGRGNKQITEPIKVEMTTNFAGFTSTAVFEGAAGVKPTTFVNAFKLVSPEGYPYLTSSYGYWVHLRSYYNRVYAQTQYFGGPAGPDVEAGGGSRFVREETYLDEYIFDRAVHKNNSYGPYGAGWTIKGVEKLTTSYDGSVVFEDGTGAYTYYLPAVPQAGKRLLQKRVMDSNENLHYHDGYFYGASCSSNEVFRVDMLGRYTTLISNSTHREIGLNCPTSVFPA